MMMVFSLRTYTMLSVYFCRTDFTVSAFSRTKVSKLCPQL